MNFEFAPWERLTSEVVDGPADVRLEVEGKVWLVRDCGELLWARRADLPAREWNYLMRPIEAWNTVSGVTRFEPSLQKAAFFLEQERRAALMRVWQLGEDAFIGWNRNFEWLFYSKRGLQDYEGYEGYGLDIEWHRTPARRTSASQVWQLLQNELARPDSALATYVAHFAVPKTQRSWFAIETRVGTPQEFADLVQMALRAFHPQWPVGTTSMQLNWKDVALRPNYLSLDVSHLGIRERAIIGHLVRRFEPRLRPNLSKHCEVLLSHDGWPEISAQAPSMHERIEAAIELRAWLQTHWPEGVKHLGKVV